MHRFARTCLLLAIVGHVIHGAEPTAYDDAALAGLVATWKPVTTLRADIVQRTTRPDDEATTTLAGHLDLQLPPPAAAADQPVLYNLVLTDPANPAWRQRFFTDGEDAFEVEQLDEREAPVVRRQALGRDDPELTRNLACVRLDLPVLNEEFTVAVQGAGEGWRLTLTPRKPALARQIATLAIDCAADARVHAITITRTGGDVQVISVERAEYGTPIPPQTFRLAQTP